MSEFPNFTLDEYQVATEQYDISTSGRFNGFNHTLIMSMGLAGEAGEVIEKVKKAWRDDDRITTERREEIKKELGDVLWYLARLSADQGYALSDIADTNLNKLRDRKINGRIKGSGDNR